MGLFKCNDKMYVHTFPIPTFCHMTARYDIYVRIVQSLFCSVSNLIAIQSAIHHNIPKKCMEAYLTTLHVRYLCLHKKQKAPAD